MATVVPGDSAPEKDAGLGLPPVTDIVKFAAVAVPPLSLMTCLMTINFGSALWNVHVASVGVVPVATLAVAVLPLNVQFVPPPETKP